MRSKKTYLKKLSAPSENALTCIRTLGGGSGLAGLQTETRLPEGTPNQPSYTS